MSAGEVLPLTQADVVLRGHAIECRIYAEDPDNNFFPSPGKILARRVPSGPGIRLDEGVYPGWIVPTEYDPILGKLIAWGMDRGEAIARLRRALEEYYVSGINTNLSLFRRILADSGFQRGEIHTRWLDEWLKASHRSAAEGPAGTAAEDAALVAALLWHLKQNRASGAIAQRGEHPVSGWKLEGRREQLDRMPRP
jgi:acetyl-CoA carboxylase biotin carboxylase subunit